MPQTSWRLSARSRKIGWLMPHHVISRLHPSELLAIIIPPPKNLKGNITRTGCLLKEKAEKGQNMDMSRKDRMTHRISSKERGRTESSTWKGKKIQEKEYRPAASPQSIHHGVDENDVDVERLDRMQGSTIPSLPLFPGQGGSSSLSERSWSHCCQYPRKSVYQAIIIDSTTLDRGLDLISFRKRGG
jgi:hypothetical protein